MKEKPPQSLEAQLENAEQEVGERIAPNHSRSRESVLGMTEHELKETFPKRYEIYVDLLRKTENVVEAKKWLGILNSLDEYIDRYEHEISEDPRQPIQQEVFRTLRDFLEQGNTDGYIKLPTGSGKTVIFKRFLEAIRQRSLIVVPNNILVDQTVKHLAGSSAEQDVGILNQYAKDYEAGSIVTTYASLVRNVNNGSLKPEDFSCLVLDEAHKALGKESSDAINKFSHAIRIGFTATPEFSETKTLKQLLDKEIYRMEVAEAIRAGALSHARTLAVKTNINLASVGIQKGQYVEKELAGQINDKARNQLAVDYYKANFEGKSGVAYCVGVAHAESMAKLFNEAGISAEVISGKTKKDDRKNVIERFKSGETTILCNADILIEGFDADNATVCLNLRPTMSAVVAEQRGGRVLRLNERDPDKVGYIVDFLDDDQLAENLSRPYPILYRDVLGAVAVPRAVANNPVGTKSEQGSLDKGSSAATIPGLEVMGTEEQFMEILQKKEKYKSIAKQRQLTREATQHERLEREERFRQYQLEREKEERERAEKRERQRKEFIEAYPAIKERLVRAESLLKTIKQEVSAIFEPQSGKEVSANEQLVGIPAMPSVPWQVQSQEYEIKDSFNHLLGNLRELNRELDHEQKNPDSGIYEFAKGSHGIRQIDDLEKGLTDLSRRIPELRKQMAEIREREAKVEKSRNLADWKTKSDFKNLAKELKVDLGSVYTAANNLKKDRPEWTDVRLEPQGNEANVYSPEFFEELRKILGSGKSK